MLNARSKVSSFARALAVLAGCCPLLAQGITWVDSPQAPRSSTLHIRELANGDWALCFYGWSTSSTGPLAGGDEAAAVGTDYGSRTVRATESDFLRGGTGGQTPAAPLFPFVVDQGVAGLFAARSGLPIQWYAFRAAIAGPVPDHGMGSLSFRVEFQSPHTANSARQWLANAQAGVAKVDAQGNPTGRVFIVSASSVQLAAIAYYKFDRGQGGAAINYAGIEGGALGQARLQPVPPAPWPAGRFATALPAGTACDTGYHGDLGGRFTVACFLREKNAPTGESPLFALGPWRCFTGGTAGTGLRCVGWGGAPAALDLTDDVQARARNGWIHVALTVDSDSLRARWYVDGVLRRTINLNPANGLVSIPADPGTLIVGGSQCTYDLDEFRLTAEAVSAATIAAWASDSPAAAQPFSLACGANLRHEGQPVLGGTVHYRIEGAPGAHAGLFLAAVARPPLDLVFFGPELAGCPWFSDFGTLLGVVQIPATGFVEHPLPIPNLPHLRGLAVYNQALVLEPGVRWRATNAHALSLR